MNSLQSLASASILWGGLMLGLGTSSVLAADFKTTFALSSAIGTPAVDTVIFNWSTNLTSGTVTPSDLTNWSYELLNGVSSVYTETVILGGVVQPIGGVTRTLADLVFDFDLGTLTFNDWDNDLDVIQDRTATGVTYNIYKDFSPTNFVIERYEDGNYIFIGSGLTFFSQSTMEVTPSATTPEPATLLGLLAGGSIGVLSRKRKG